MLVDLLGDEDDATDIRRALHRYVQSEPAPWIDYVSNCEPTLPIEIIRLTKVPSGSWLKDDPELLPQKIATLVGHHAVVRRHHDDLAPMVDYEYDDGELSVGFFLYSGLRGAVKEHDWMSGRAPLRKRVLAAILRRPKEARGEEVAFLFPDTDDAVPPSPHYLLAELLRQEAGLAEGRGELANVLHFACHLRDGVAGPALELKGRESRDVFRVELDQLADALKNSGPPAVAPRLVFLNACRTGAVPPQWPLSAVEAIKSLAARTIIASLAEVPDMSAAKFAEYFYMATRTGVTIDQAMHEARRSLFKGHQNPFGYLLVGWHGGNVQLRHRVSLAPPARYSYASAASTPGG